MQLHRASNQAIVRLGRPLGRGGEGAVYRVDGNPRVVAKIYWKPPDAAKAEKLGLMARRHTPAMLRVAAWPTELLLDERGALRGFLMPRISARQDVHRLYSPRSRRKAFPEADFRFVVRVATNLARAFAQIHAQDHVIGDVNHGNALIGGDGTVMLIDCDSFQVREHGRVFTCDVGSPLFTPPELQGLSFRGMKRSAANDDFGLAVLLFHLLYLGRHPFAGRYAEGEMPIERAIAEHRFAYGADAAARGMTAPPGALSLSAHGAEIAQLFERAFAAAGEKTRPSAQEWIGGLSVLESRLAACPASATHWRLNSGGECCWCAIEKRTGLTLFGRRIDNTLLDAASIERLWKQIEEVPPPAPDAPLPPIPIRPGDPLFLDRADPPSDFLSGYLLIGFCVLVLTSIAIGELPMSGDLQFWVPLTVTVTVLLGVAHFRKSMRKPGANKSEELDDKWRQASKAWERATSSQIFHETFGSLTRVMQRVRSNLAERDARLKTRQIHVQEQHRLSFLDDFLISDAKFKELDGIDVALLESNGIESAGDAVRQIDRVEELLKYRRSRELLRWTQLCGDKFTFDPDAELYDEEAERIQREWQMEHLEILTQLRDGADSLRNLRAQVESNRHSANQELHKTFRQLRTPQ